MVLVCFGFNVQSNFIRYYKIIGFYHWCSNGGQQNFISFFWPVSPELCHSFTPFFRRSPMLDPAASTLLLKMAGKSPTSASRCESQVELSGIDMIWLVVWLPLFIFPEIFGLLVIPIDELTFFRGVAKDHQPVICSLPCLLSGRHKSFHGLS